MAPVSGACVMGVTRAHWVADIAVHFVVCVKVRFCRKNNIECQQIELKYFFVIMQFELYFEVPCFCSWLNLG